MLCGFPCLLASVLQATSEFRPMAKRSGKRSGRSGSVLPGGGFNNRLSLSLSLSLNFLGALEAAPREIVWLHFRYLQQKRRGKLLAGRRRARVRNRRAASPRSLVHNKDSRKMIYQNGRSRRLFTENGASALERDAASGRSPGASAHARLNRDATPEFVGRPLRGGRSCSSRCVRRRSFKFFSA